MIQNEVAINLQLNPNNLNIRMNRKIKRRQSYKMQQLKSVSMSETRCTVVFFA